MKQITVNIPKSLDITEREICLALASKLYEEGRLSLGHAAEMVGITKRAFAELLGLYNVSLFNHPASDLARDFKNA